MSALLTNTQWAEARQKDFAERTGAARAFWPELKRAFLDLVALEPAKSHIVIGPEEDENPHLFVVSAGVFDLKLATDPLSDTIFYAFTSSTLKKLIPTESAIYHYGQLKVARGLWGVIDGPGDEVHRVFADDPQTVEQVPSRRPLCAMGARSVAGRVSGDHRTGRCCRSESGSRRRGRKERGATWRQCHKSRSSVIRSTPNYGLHSSR